VTIISGHVQSFRYFLLQHIPGNH